MSYIPVIPALKWRPDQEFKAIFGYIVNLRPAWDILNPVSKVRADEMAQ